MKTYKIINFKSFIAASLVAAQVFPVGAGAQPHSAVRFDSKTQSWKRLKPEMIEATREMQRLVERKKQGLAGTKSKTVVPVEASKPASTEAIVESRVGERAVEASQPAAQEKKKPVEFNTSPEARSYTILTLGGLIAAPLVRLVSKLLIRVQTLMISMSEKRSARQQSQLENAEKELREIQSDLAFLSSEGATEKGIEEVKARAKVIQERIFDLEGRLELGKSFREEVQEAIKQSEKSIKEAIELKGEVMQDIKLLAQVRKVEKETLRALNSKANESGLEEAFEILVSNSHLFGKAIFESLRRHISQSKRTALLGFVNGDSSKIAMLHPVFGRGTENDFVVSIYDQKGTRVQDLNYSELKRSGISHVLLQNGTVLEAGKEINESRIRVMSPDEQKGLKTNLENEGSKVRAEEQPSSAGSGI